MNRIQTLRGNLAVLLASYDQIQLAQGEVFIHITSDIADLSAAVLQEYNKIQEAAGHPTLTKDDFEVKVYDQNNKEIIQVCKGDLIGGYGAGGITVTDTRLTARVFKLGGSGDLKFGGLIEGATFDVAAENESTTKGDLAKEAINNPWTIYQLVSTDHTTPDAEDRVKYTFVGDGDYFFASDTGVLYVIQNHAADANRIKLTNKDAEGRFINNVIGFGLAMGWFEPTLEGFLTSDYASGMRIKELADASAAGAPADFSSGAAYINKSTDKITFVICDDGMRGLAGGELGVDDEWSGRTVEKAFVVDTNDILYFPPNNGKEPIVIPIGSLVKDSTLFKGVIDRADEYAKAMYAEHDDKLLNGDEPATIKTILEDLYKTKVDVDPVTKKIISSQLPDSILGGTKFVGTITNADLGYVTGAEDEDCGKSLVEIVEALFKKVDADYDFDHNGDLDSQYDQVLKNGMYFIYTGPKIKNCEALIKSGEEKFEDISRETTLVDNYISATRLFRSGNLLEVIDSALSSGSFSRGDITDTASSGDVISIVNALLNDAQGDVFAHALQSVGGAFARTIDSFEALAKNGFEQITSEYAEHPAKGDIVSIDGVAPSVDVLTKIPNFSDTDGSTVVTIIRDLIDKGIIKATSITIDPDGTPRTVALGASAEDEEIEAIITQISSPDAASNLLYSINLTVDTDALDEWIEETYSFRTDIEVTYTANEQTSWIHDGIINGETVQLDADGNKSIGKGDWLVWNGDMFDLVDHTEEFNSINIKSSTADKSGSVVYDPTLEVSRRTTSGTRYDGKTLASTLIEVDPIMDDESSFTIKVPSVLLSDMENLSKDSPLFYNGDGTSVTLDEVKIVKKGTEIGLELGLGFLNLNDEGTLNLEAGDVLDLEEGLVSSEDSELIANALKVLGAKDSDTLKEFFYEEAKSLAYETENIEYKLPAASGTLALQEDILQANAYLKALIEGLQETLTPTGTKNYLQTLDENKKIVDSKLEQVIDEDTGRITALVIHTETKADGTEVDYSNTEILFVDDLSEIGDYGASEARKMEDGIVKIDPFTGEKQANQLVRPKDESVKNYMPNHSGVLLNDNSIIDCGIWV